MAELVLHPRTAEQLALYQINPTQALLITAPTGSGKLAVAQQITGQLLGVTAEKVSQHPYVQLLSSDQGLGIEVVRELQHFMSLRVPSQEAITRVVIIDGGDKLTIEAQNALLKTLEEPQAGSQLILTASNPLSLLPTIRSRLQVMQLQKPTTDQLHQHFASRGFADKDIAQAITISAGLPALATALLNQTDHPLITAVEYARSILSATAFDRLTMVDELSKQKSLTENVLQLLQHMAQLRLRTAHGKASLQWQQILTASYKASEALSQSGQPKLILTNLMLSLS